MSWGDWKYLASIKTVLLASRRLHNGRNQSSFPPLLQLLLLEGALLSFWSCLWLLSVCVGMPQREKKVLFVHPPEEFLFLLEIWMHRTRGLELIFFFFFFDLSERGAECLKKRSQQSSALVHGDYFTSALEECCHLRTNLSILTFWVQASSIFRKHFRKHLVIF